MLEAFLSTSERIVQSPASIALLSLFLFFSSVSMFVYDIRRYRNELNKKIDECEKGRKWDHNYRLRTTNIMLRAIAAVKAASGGRRNLDTITSLEKEVEDLLNSELEYIKSENEDE